MSQISGYPKAAFGPNAWLLGYSNSNSQTTLFTAQSVIDYFNLDEINEELLVRVRSFTTNQLAITEDMPLNTILYTAGNTAVSDGGGGSWIVVESGGSINMNNGFQMKLLPVGDLAGSDATLTLVDSDTGTAQTLQDALNDRSGVFDGQTNVDVSGGTNIILTGDQARNKTIRFFGTTTGDITVSTPNNDARTWLIINDDTGGNTITFKTSTGTGVEFSLQGEDRYVRSDGTNMQNQYNWALGEERNIDTSIGEVLPDNSSDQKFVLLTEGLTAGYNAGLINNEVSQVVTASNGFDYLEKTADLLVGPWAGQTIHLYNSEESQPVPGETSGLLVADQIQDFELKMDGADRWLRHIAGETLGVASGAAPDTARVALGGPASAYDQTLLITEPNSATLARTGTENKPKSYTKQRVKRVA